jgi:hypothetical protein
MPDRSASTACDSSLKTDGRGDYQLWLDHGFSPLEIIAAKDGYTPVMKVAKITKGGTTTANFVIDTKTFLLTKLSVPIDSNTAIDTAPATHVTHPSRTP